MLGHLRRQAVGLLVVAGATIVSGAGGSQGGAAPSDLDAFMARVLARRDDNWKKLQQYVLDERETVEVRAPGRIRLFGMERDYTWFERDGYFVRSPIRFDGVTLSEDARRAYERDWLEREKKRDARAKKDNTPEAAPPTPAGLEEVVRQGHEPYFVSVAYFLRFVFEPGHYTLVGPESLDGRRVLRIEYYPSQLHFDDPDEQDKEDEKNDHDKPRKPGEAEREAAVEARLQQQMNKVALVTLWIEPDAQQIVKYTFDNVGFDFLPGRSLIRIDKAQASMAMGEVFPGVWLPKAVEGRAAVTLAQGTFEVDYDLTYSQYRQAEVKVRVR